MEKPSHHPKRDGVEEQLRNDLRIPSTHRGRISRERRSGTGVLRWITVRAKGNEVGGLKRHPTLKLDPASYKCRNRHRSDRSSAAVATCGHPVKTGCRKDHCDRNGDRGMIVHVRHFDPLRRRHRRTTRQDPGSPGTPDNGWGVAGKRQTSVKRCFRHVLPSSGSWIGLFYRINH